MGAVISLEMAVVLFGGFRVGEPQAAVATLTSAAGHVAQYSNTRELGALLYSEYLYPVEIAAVILLVAMITAIALTLRERKDSKRIDPSRQVSVRARDRFELVKLAPTRAAPPPAPAPASAEEAKK
jgi:NADH-quinone oxidoreductase subunit J